jgi:hypothetical protein
VRRLARRKIDGPPDPASPIIDGMFRYAFSADTSAVADALQAAPVRAFSANAFGGARI